MKMDSLFILKDGKPKEEPDINKWLNWLSKNLDKRGIAKESINGITISTVFLGINHSFGPGKPILWETMIFGGKYDQNIERCSGTVKDALKMHKRIKNKVEKNLSKKKNIIKGNQNG